MTATGTHLYLTLNGAAVCYDDWGTGNLPVLFIHGFPFDKSTWHPQMNVLKQDHRVIAYDISGFGKSTVRMEMPNIELYADDLIHFMDALGISRAIVCGLSMGGYILLNAVRRFPHRFEAVVLCDTQCTADTPEAREKRKEAIIQVMSGKLNGFAEKFIPKLFNPGEPDPELVSRIKEIILSTAPETITGALNALKNRQETCSFLPQINLPALIICGEQDQVTPPSKSEELHLGIKDSEFYLVPDAGHLSNLEQPEIFTRRLMEFLSRFKN